MTKANFRCNHCGSDNVTATGEGKNVNRGHCNDCYTGTSDTAGTIWHKTQLPPEKREQIKEAYDEGKGVRETARDIGVNKDTVSRAFRLFH
ncbi:MAG TPA: helix-turn-helix domain-containing protein [Cyanophyceae cyanobacterium]